MKELTERGLRLPHAKALVEKLSSFRTTPVVSEPETKPVVVGKGIGKGSTKTVEPKITPKAKEKLTVAKLNFSVGNPQKELRTALEEMFQKHQR